MSVDVCTAGCSNPWVCTQCGVCAAICPAHAVTMVSRRFGHRYPEVSKENCVSCGLCTESCPGPRLTANGGYHSPTEAEVPYGPLEVCGLGWASEAELRTSASSGGFVTSLLVALLDTGAIRGALVTDLGADGCLPRTWLARTPQEMRQARGSKYMLSSVTEGLTAISKAEDGPFAVVGLPCHIQGARRAMDAVCALRGKIGLCVSLFCGGTKDFRYRSLLARKMDLDEARLVRFAFRGGGWPGEMSGEDASGRTATMRGADRTLGRIWRTARLTPPRCLLCDDPLGVAADIAVGDPWRIDHARDELGKSLVLVRTPAGASAVDMALQHGGLQIDWRIGPGDVLTSAEGILWRRFYAPSRVWLAALWARGWRATARTLPRPPARLLAQAARAFIISQWRW